MATINATLTAAWVRLATPAVTRLLVSTTSANAIEIAVTDADAAPGAGVSGHYLDHTQAASRDLLGPGYIWARVAPGQIGATAVVVIT
jgi:hypothetical protein